MKRYRNMALFVPVILGFVTLTASVNVPNFEAVNSAPQKIIKTASTSIIEQPAIKNVNQTKSITPGQSTGWDSSGEVLP